MKDWQNKYKDKIVSPEVAIAKGVQSNSRVVISHACAEPQTLVKALVAGAPNLKNVEIIHMVAMGKASYTAPELAESFHHNALFVGGSTRKAVSEGRASYTPCFFSEVPSLFREKILPVQTALIQISLPDEEGYCSYGVSVDYGQVAAESAQVVIAQMNTFSPRTGGAKIHLDQIQYLVLKDEPLIELRPPTIGEIEKKIGENVASLIEDGSTLQLGIGAIPDAVLLFLKEKKDLGIHSEMFSDGVVELAEAGVITNKKKTLHPGKFIATFLMGTRRLYDFVDNNPDVEMHPVDYTNDPFIVAQNEKLMSINSAIQVDFMGQVNAEVIGGKQFSGIGGQVDFVRGARRSKGGKSIIALPSTASGGKVSRIVCELDPGSAVSTSRNDVDYIVTEYGIAYLRGKTLHQRAEELIKISHPDFQAQLTEKLQRMNWF